MTDHIHGEGRTLIGTAFEEMMAVEMMAREKELYAAWRSEYDFLYVLSNYSMMDITLEFIPSNNPDYKFGDYRVEQYDLREENISPREREMLISTTITNA